VETAADDAIEIAKNASRDIGSNSLPIK
jgi:hypothetical protein